MFHYYFLTSFAFKRVSPCQEFEQDYSKSIDVDFPSILPFSNFRSHVVEGSDTLRVITSLAVRYDLGKAVVADLYESVADENVSRLEVPVDHTVVMQILHSSGNMIEPRTRVILS